MHNEFNQHDAFVTEFSARLTGLSDQDLAIFVEFTLWFAENYATGYELNGSMWLVLDNSIIQEFKHRNSQHKRGLRALAYTAFCRFVVGWSDRPSFLALSPAAIYEHLGRRSVKTTNEAAAALTELEHLLADTRLPVTGLGFTTPHELKSKLNDVEADERFVTQYVKDLDATNWQKDLRAPMGVKIPFGIAYAAIPDNLPLRYFDPWYVKFVLSGRIERHIVQQSQHDPEAMPIGSGELMEALANLNDLSKRGILKGLGDIDMLQICDVSRQYQQKKDYVLIGQTLDRGLAEVLSRRHIYSVGAGVEGGDPKRNERIEEMVSLMFSNPFAEQDKRAHSIRLKLVDFLSAVEDACISAQLNATQ